MDNKKKFLVLGGDLRIVYAAEKLAEYFDVFAYGFDNSPISFKKAKPISDLSCFENKSDMILLPLPVTRNGITVNAPLCQKDIPLDIVSELLKENGIVYGGSFGDKASKIFNDLNIRTVDYFENEELNIINAEATAEGALMTAIMNTDHTLFGSDILITGYGRIAKMLAGMLKGIGANVTIAARKSTDRKWASVMGHMTTDTVNIDLNKYQIIFNTVPMLIFTKEVLQTASDNCLIIELASKPGGIDLEWADKLSIRTICAMGLPGKTAPKTSGEIIAETILK